MYRGLYTHLVKAKELLPIKVAPYLCKGDLQRIHTGFGKMWYEKGKKVKLNKLDRHVEMLQSEEHYIKAIAINPHDILAVLGIAETTAELEFTFAALFPGKKNKYNALPLYKRVRQVEPNGVDSNYSITRYLYRKGLKEELYSQVEHCAKIYPSYGKLKKEPFYSVEITEAIKEGLQQAVKESIMVNSAYFSLSSLHEEEKLFAEAAVLYRKGMEYQRDGNTARNHLKLGTLLLRADNKKRANEAFITALKKSSTVPSTVRNIYYRFRNQKEFIGFIEFAALAEANTISTDELQFSIAKAQIELKNYEAAKETLIKINAENSNHLAYYMLAELGRKERDWDSMELDIQKATVLEPRNGKYFNILADALIYQKKYKPAAEYMQKALANDPDNQTYKKKLNKIRSYHN